VGTVNGAGEAHGRDKGGGAPGGVAGGGGTEGVEAAEQSGARDWGR
jgi:hypothetical protein